MAPVRVCAIITLIFLAPYFVAISIASTCSCPSSR